MPHRLPLSHVHVAALRPDSRTLQVPCETGDFALLTITADGGVLISLDDVDKTLPGPDGEATVPTVQLSRTEAVALLRWLYWALRRPWLGAESST